MAYSKKSQKIKHIENNIIVYYSDDEANTKHTVESKRLLSIARRSRTVQPNQGTSKKSSNFYQQLNKDYNLSAKFDNTPDEKEWRQILHEMLDRKDEKEFKEWLKANKHKFVLNPEDTKNLGIITDYHNQYGNFAEIKIEEVIYDNNEDNMSTDIEKEIEQAKELNISMMEYDEFLQKLEKDLQHYQFRNFSEEFLQYYQEVEMFKFDMYTDSKILWEEVEEKFSQIFDNKEKKRISMLQEKDIETYEFYQNLEKKVKYMQKELKKREKTQ